MLWSFSSQFQLFILSLWHNNVAQVFSFGLFPAFSLSGSIIAEHVYFINLMYFSFFHFRLFSPSDTVSWGESVLFWLCFNFFSLPGAAKMEHVCLINWSDCSILHPNILFSSSSGTLSRREWMFVFYEVSILVSEHLSHCCWVTCALLTDAGAYAFLLSSFLSFSTVKVSCHQGVFSSSIVSSFYLLSILA